MVLSLADTCIRAIDLPQHKIYYKKVLQEMLRFQANREMKRIFSRGGTLTYNIGGRLGSEFKLTSRLFFEKRSISIVLYKLLVKTRVERDKVRRMVRRLILEE